MATNIAASVLMPVGRVHSFLLPAVQSILQQTFTGLELILIDDAGGQVAQAVASLNDSRMRVVTCAGHGIADALNTGTAAAQGAFWFRCDSDDLYPLDRLRSQITFLKDHPEFGAVTGSMAAMTPDGKSVANMNARSTAGEITDELRNGKARSSLCSWAVRMDIIRNTAGFRRYFLTAEDIDMQFRLGEKCRVWFEADLVYHYRLHDHSITHSLPSDKLRFFDARARDFQLERTVAGTDCLERREPPPVPDFLDGKPVGSRIQDLMISTAWEHHRNGRKLKALRAGLRAFFYSPAKPQAWKTLAALAIKPVGHPARATVKP